MRVLFKDWTDISKVLKFNAGINLTYGKGTMKGCAWCPCSRCVGNLLFKTNKVVGWIYTQCVCGNKVNWTDADKYI